MLMSFNDYEMNVSSIGGGGAEATNTRIVWPQVFVINLDSAQDRLAQFSGRLDKFGVPFTRWRATSGDELDASSFGILPTADGIYISGFREWSKNEAACGVSHVRLLQHIVRQGLPWAIVMEDDAVLLDRLPATLSEWKLPPDADIVLLNDRVTTGPVSHGDKPYAYGRVTGGAGTDGYLISLAGAHALLHILNPLREPLDFQMYAHFVSIQEHDKAPFYWKLPQNPAARHVLLTAYGVVPALVGHPDSPSTIGGQRHPRARYYCKVLLGLDLPDLHSYAPFVASSEAKITGMLRTTIPEYRAVDVSHLDESLTYIAGSGCPPQEPMAILSQHGVNCVRISLWVDPQSVMNLERALHLARRAYAAGLAVCLVLHYSDYWADPTHQSKPATWANLPFEALCNQVYTYTRSVVEALGAQGTPPSIVQVGNEITNGLLWGGPNETSGAGGRLFDVEEAEGHARLDPQWATFANIMRYATKGVREAACPNSPPIYIMMQIDKGARPEVAAWWFDHARAHGLDFDIIGLSYYFLWHHATLDELERLSCLSAAFPDKGIMLAETSYPHRNAEGIVMEPPPGQPLFTATGQAEYLAATLRSMRALRNGCGVCWWGAFFLNDAFDRCEDLFQAQALFDARGSALPALSMFRAPQMGGAE